MKKIFANIILLVVGTSLNAQLKVITLADLRLNGYSQEILQPMRNQSMTGDRMRVAKRRFDDGISVHAPFAGYIYTGKKASRFKGSFGMDDVAGRHLEKASLDSITRTDGLKTFFYTDEKTSERTLYGVGYSSADIKPGSAELQIYGDGRQLWSSGVLNEGNKSVDFDVDIQNISILQLKVNDGGDGISGDLTDLGLLRIETTDPALVKFVAENYMATAGSNPPNQYAGEVLAAVKKIPISNDEVAVKDWLLEKSLIKTSVGRTKDNQLVLNNGLISRTIQINPNAATISLKNLVTGEEFIRAVEPEAIVKIDNEEFDVGGLAGQTDRGYLLTDWLKEMYSLPNAFELRGFEVRDLQPASWKPKRWIPKNQWKASGKELILSFVHPDKKGITVQVHHKMYDGIPLLCKSITVINNSNSAITLDNFTGEIIAYPEVENAGNGQWSKPNFYMENDYAFGGMSYAESNQSISWETDPAYTSQVNYLLQTTCMVKSKPRTGPAQVIQPAADWNSFSTYTLMLDGRDKERNGLSLRKMYRLLAPWSTENPIFMHLTSTVPEVVQEAVDQCVKTGYEMIILSFGSGFNMENTSQANLDKYRKMAEYAHSRGIEIGGYSLFSSRTIGPMEDVIDIKTGKPGGAKFRNAPCLGSNWGIDYLQKLQHFFEYTGFDLLEHDGPYPGDFCASKTHPGHTGYDDSQWKQWKQTVAFYQWMQKRDVYMNVPDVYFLSGSNKSGIGYREVNWSLPRAQQIMLGRQNIYDGTWTRTPSMGWTFVPLVQYHGGGAAATLEPLSEHLKEYAAHMQQNYGSGVQACYRGNRLYDTDATKELVKQNISHYKKYRDILNADIIHLKRPTGRDWDGILHVDPTAEIKGYALLYNPLDEKITRTIKLPLYYTGINGKAMISVEGQPAKLYQADAQNNISVSITIPAGGNVAVVINKAKK